MNVCVFIVFPQYVSFTHAIGYDVMFDASMVKIINNGENIPQKTLMLMVRSQNGSSKGSESGLAELIVAQSLGKPN
jgi:hypothetical protein